MNRGFTLLELLVAAGIVALLASMAMPLVSIAKNSAMKSSTKAIMGQVEAALRLFREEARVYPWQARYSNVSSNKLSSSMPDGVPLNRLGWHLGTTMTTAQQIALRDDQDTAANGYFYGYNLPLGHVAMLGTNLNWREKKMDGGDLNDTEKAAGWWESQPGCRGSVAFGFKREEQSKTALWTESMQIWGEGNPGSGDYDWNTTTEAANGRERHLRYSAVEFLNRVAKERARVGIASGYIAMTGTKVLEVNGSNDGVITKFDKSGTKLIAGAAASAANPGWADDYLGGDIEAKYRSGEQILDAWRRPIVYIGNVIPAARGLISQAMAYNVRTPPLETGWYGLGATGRKPLSRNAAGDAKPTSVRAEVSLKADGSAELTWREVRRSDYTPTDATYFPDANDLMRADARLYAAPGMVYEFELLSAGRDGYLEWMRNESVNIDNVSGGDYVKGLR